MANRYILDKYSISQLNVVMLMNRQQRHYFISIPACLMMMVLAGSSVVSAETPKPNIIYIMCDETGYFEVGFMGGQLIETPHLDQMAAEGMIFNNILAGGPSCAPTRATLLTGKHLGHTSVRTNFGEEPLRADERTIASILKPLGYATGGFGKWGVGGRDSTGIPEIHGFDDFFGYYHQVHAHTYYPPYLLRNSEEIPFEGNFGLPGEGETYSAYVIHEAAKQFIRDHADGPFFAYLPYTPPHGIYQIPQDDPAWELYKDATYDDGTLWPLGARRYAAMSTMLDRHVGEILALLKELGIEENTLVFFSGDNGGVDRWDGGLFSPNNDPLGDLEFRGGKGSLYDGALRVPFCAWWPGTIAPGQVSDHLGYFPDILPTIAEAVGTPIPVEVDGISILPTLIGEDAAGGPQGQHDYLYWEYFRWRAIRQGDWKAVDNRGWELYNVTDNPSESINLAAVHPQILDDLISLANSARTPIQEGTFTTTERSARDKAAKGGNQDSVAPVPLILRYPLNGNANDVANAGTLNHNATLHGGTYVPSLAQHGQCILLDGQGDYLQTPLLIGTSFTSLTFGGWIHLNQLPASDTHYRIVDFSTSTPEIGGFDVDVTHDGRLVFSTGYSDAPHKHTLQTGPNRISAGRWVHVAVTFDTDSPGSGVMTGTKRIYLDGMLELSQSSCPYRYFTLLADGAMIGAGTNPQQDSDYFFNGKLDDIRLYNRALDAEDIAQMMAIIPPPVDIMGDQKIHLADLVALIDYWLEDDCFSKNLCDGRDLNADQQVDLEDFRILSQNWLVVQDSPGGPSIGISFLGASDQIGPIGPEETAGFAGYEQSIWNVAEGASGTVEDLLDSVGVTTAASLTFSANGVWGRGDVPDTPDGRLMTGWLDGRGATTIIELSNVPYTTYNIVLYSDGPGEFLRGREVNLLDASDDSVIAGPYYFRDPMDSETTSGFFDGTFTRAALNSINNTDVMPVGNVWIYEGLTRPHIRVEVNAGAHNAPNERYPVNAIQIYGL